MTPPHAAPQDTPPPTDVTGLLGRSRGGRGRGGRRQATAENARHGGRAAGGGENARHDGRAAVGGRVEALPGDFDDSPDCILGEQVQDPAVSPNFHICANDATCKTVGKERGVDENQLVLWNEAKFPGLTKTAKLRKGTRLVLIAPASDEDSHKNAPSRRQQQTESGDNAKGKPTPGAGKRKRPSAQPIEDVLVGRNVFVNTGTDLMMPMARVIKTAGDDSYQVLLEGQEKIVKSMNMVMRVSELEKDHWPTLVRCRASVTVQRREPDVVGPATFNGPIVALEESQFTVQTQNRAEYETKADEMLIAADMVLKALRPITMKRPSRTAPPKRDKSAPKPDTPLQPPSREEKKNIDMVASFMASEQESERKKERASERENKRTSERARAT